MPSEAAKVAYVGLICKLQPDFTPIPGKGSGGASSGGPMGPVFSCMAADAAGPSELEANLGPVSPLLPESLSHAGSRVCIMHYSSCLGLWQFLGLSGRLHSAC